MMWCERLAVTRQPQSNQDCNNLWFSNQMCTIYSYYDNKD